MSTIKRTNILSLDAGGIKGIYSLILISGIEDKFNVSFNKNFEYYIGTSIGGVVSTALAYGVAPKEILNQFTLFKNDFHKGHIYLLNKLFSWIDQLFGKESFLKISKKLFIPVYNYSKREFSFFGYNSPMDNNIPIAEVLKSACSDIRIIPPFKIDRLNLFFADAGFFAYDPIMFFLRTNPVLLSENSNILSIGSGLIENISEDLSRGENFDIIYDTFLNDQFYTIAFFFNIATQQYGLNYIRISEFLKNNNTSITIDEIIYLANKKIADLSLKNLSIFN